MKFETYIATRYLTAKHTNRFINIVTVFSIGGILVGVAALIIVLSIMNGFESEVRERIIGATAHLTIYSMKPEGISDWRLVLERVSQIEEVVGASPFVTSKGAIAGPKSTDGVMIRGADPEFESATSTVPNSIKLGEFALCDPDDGTPTILLGIYLAGGIGAEAGDTVTLFVLKPGTVTSSSMPLAKQFVVAGIFETGMYDYDAMLCYIPLSSAQKMFAMGDAVTGIQLKVRDFYKADKIGRKIEKSLGFPYYAVPWSQMNKSLYAWMTLEKWAMFLVLLLIIGVAAFNIVSTLMMVVMEKTVDIGILKSMGATDRSLVRIFLLQGGIVGILGTLLGTILGVLAVWIQNTYKVISLPPEVYSISALPMKLMPMDLVIICAFSILISLVSAYYPAWRAAKLNPVEAIRYG